jgi:peptidoglycan L-alanyl-D-glutamate endopeptidase CwlK
MYEIDWQIVMFVCFAGVIFLVAGLAGWLIWRRMNSKAPRPDQTVYGTLMISRKKLGLPPLQSKRAPLQPGPQPPASYQPLPPASPPAPMGVPPPQGYPPPPQPWGQPPAPGMPQPQYPPPPAPGTPYPQYPPQAAAGLPPSQYPPAPAPGTPLPQQPPPMPPQVMPTKQAPIPGVAPGATETFIGKRFDKTVYIRSGVKIMMPKRERNLLKLVPVMIIVAAGAGIYLGYRFLFADNRTQRLDREDHVGGRLTGERLVPPPDLPPSFFRNTERPELVELDRNWGHLNPDFAQAVLRMMKQMEAKGRPFVLLEGYRSAERQTRLSQMGYHVTRAAAFQSQHQYGLAADLAPLKDGRISISERDPWTMEAYRMMGQAAAAEGLVWGGNWTNLRDFGHVEARKSVR